jgi:uncharacterized lipoprotein
MYRYLTRSVFVLLSALLASCALSPQQITIKPEISVPVASYGKGRDVHVRVEDRRPGTVIGTRGGVYGDTSTIEIGNDYKMEIAFAAANSLTRWGFKSQVNAPASNEKSEAAEFVLIINKLDYVPDSNPAVGKIRITAAVSVEISKGLRNYHGNYEASGEMGYVTVPSETRNNEQINMVLNLALQKMFDDQSLVKFLQ